MAEEKVDHTDRFGWHPGEAVVVLVPGAKDLPETKPEPAKKPVKPKSSR